VQVAVLGSLTLQTMLIALLAMELLGRGSSQAEAELAATQRTLDVVAKGMGSDEKDFSKKLTEARTDRDNFKLQLDTLTEIQREHNKKVAEITDDLKTAKKSEEYNDGKIKRLEADLSAARKEIRDLKTPDKAGDDKVAIDWKSPWIWGTAAVGVAIVVAGVLMFRSSKPTDDFSEETTRRADNSPPPDINDFKDPPPPTNTN
jgi:hypothetical protein